MPRSPQRQQPPRRDAARPSTGGRERIAGAALALYLISGSWSVARVAGFEPSPIWEPRVWAVALLGLLALLPATGAVRSTRSAVLPELSWLGFTLLAITWAPDLEFARPNAIDIVLLLAVTMTLYRLSRGGHIDRLADSLRAVMIVLLLSLMLTAVAGGIGSGRLAVLGGGPNVFGRNMGLLCVMALERALFADQQQPRWRGWSLMWVVIACASAGLSALSGSRGAMISTFVAASVLFVIGRGRLGRRLAVVLGVVGLFVGLLLFTPVGGQVIESFSLRVLDLLIGERYVSNRDQIYVIALEGGGQSPVIGHGLASFPASTPWPYTHNLMLDAWYETGAIGVALLGLYLGRSARLLLALDSRGRELWIALTVLVLFSAQFSGGRYDGRALLVFAAITLALPTVQRAVARNERPPA
jgi:O-antigen ligase